MLTQSPVPHFTEAKAKSLKKNRTALKGTSVSAHSQWGSEDKGGSEVGGVQEEEEGKMKIGQRGPCDCVHVQVGGGRALGLESV